MVNDDLMNELDIWKERFHKLEEDSIKYCGDKKDMTFDTSSTDENSDKKGSEPDNQDKNKLEEISSFDSMEELDS